MESVSVAVPLEWPLGPLFTISANHHKRNSSILFRIHTRIRGTFVCLHRFRIRDLSGQDGPYFVGTIPTSVWNAPLTHLYV